MLYNSNMSIYLSYIATLNIQLFVHYLFETKQYYKAYFSEYLV